MKTKEKLLKIENKKAEKKAEHKYRAQFNSREKYRSFKFLVAKIDQQAREEIENIDVNMWVIKNMFIPEKYLNEIRSIFFTKIGSDNSLIATFKLLRGIKLIKNNLFYAEQYLNLLMEEKKKEKNQENNPFSLVDIRFLDNTINKPIIYAEKLVSKLKLEQELKQKNNDKKVNKI